jgi:hypothetical protein
MPKTTQNPQQFAQNHSQLAAALGISRQSLQPYTRNPAAPKATQDGRHDVQAWMRFLNARTALLAKCAGTPNMGQAELQPEAGLSEASVYSEARVETLCDIGERLPDALAAAAELACIVIDDSQRDVLAFVCWKAFCEILKTEPAAEDIPAEIVAARSRLQAIAAGSETANAIH